MPRIIGAELVTRLFRESYRHVIDRWGRWLQPLQPGGWRFLSPSVSAFHLNNVQLIDASIGFAVGKKGVILKTDDGGNTWQAKVSGTTNDLHGVHFINSSIGIVVGSNETILRTVDGGNTWSDPRLSPSSLAITLRDVFFTDSNNGVVVGGHKLVGSGDITYDVRGIIMWTDDGGETWQQPVTILADKPHELWSIQFKDSATGIAVGGIVRYFENSVSNWRSATTLLQTADGGQTWISIESPPDQQDRPLYDVSFYDGSFGMAVGGWHDTKPIRTVNGGDIWEPTQWQWEGCGLDASVLTSVSYFDASTAIAVGGGNEAAGIYRYVQTDPESPWERIDYGSYPNLRGVSFAKDSNVGVAVGWYSTVLRSEDSGQTWTEGTIEGVSSLPAPVTECENLEDVFFIDANNGFIVDWFGTLLRTTNGGQVWTRLPDVTNFGLTCVYFHDMQNGLIGGWRSSLRQTDDGGITWKKFGTPDFGQRWNVEAVVSPSNPLIKRYFPRAIHFCDATNGVTVGLDSFTGLNKPVMLQTSNGGATWSKIALPVEVLQMDFVALEDIHCFDPQTLVAVGRRRRDMDIDHAAIILRTDDGGASWSVRTDEFEDPYNLMLDLYGVYFVNVSTGFAVGGVNVLLRTDDGGITWNRIGTTEPIPKGRFYGVHFVDENNGWIVGYHSTTAGGYSLRGIIYRTIDGGQSWTEQNVFTGTLSDKHLNDVFFVDGSTGIAVGEKGVILRTQTAGD